MVLVLIAFRQLDWFTPFRYQVAMEQSWMRWDQQILVYWEWSPRIEASGAIAPAFLELCYLLVYGVGAFSITIIYLLHQRHKVDKWLCIYLIGTLTAYSLVPFFPSQPPRIAFSAMGPEPMRSALRTFNLWILTSSSIHAGVFPSAHVASVFAAAWGMFFVLRERRWIAWGFIFYGCSVAIATVYGRYHYAADAIAGFAISITGAVWGALTMRRRP